MAIPSHSGRIAFGPFEIDAAAGEILKHGVRLRLSGQPFRILLLLVNHAGEVISQERLKNEIWGEGIFVDFEHGLHAAVNKLRQALGDSAENPRYIETVPGRGYRFIGVLERVSPLPSVAAAEGEDPESAGRAGARPRSAIGLVGHGCGLAYGCIRSRVATGGAHAGAPSVEADQAHIRYRAV